MKIEKQQIGNELYQSLNEIISSSNQDIVQENANTDGKSPIGQMSLFATEVAKEYNKKFLNEEEKVAFKDGYIHIHDFDFYATGTTTCTQIPLGKVLKQGFITGTCFMRPPTTISSAMALAAILIQANQNQQHGGQAYPNFDYDLAPYVEKSYNKYLEKYTELGIKDPEKQALKDTEKETLQACEGFVHNCNSMLSRNGMQVPFTSINFGLDTSKWGRIISRSILQAQIAGLGDGSTPIFPILIFKLKKGVNFYKKDENYDLYQLSLECLSKRLFPNFQFVDTPFNIKGFDIDNPDTHIATMGCVRGHNIVEVKNVGFVAISTLIDKFGVTPATNLEVRDIDGSWVKVKNLIKNPDIGNWVHIKNNDGREITVTDDHPFVTQRGRVLARDLTLDDTLVKFSNNNIVQDTYIWNEEAWLDGLMMTNGHYSDDIVSISIDNDEEEMVTLIQNSLKNVYNIDSKVIYRKRDTKGSYIDIVSIGSVAAIINKLLDKFGDYNKNNRNIPAYVYNGDNNVKASFIAGMFDGDGYISKYTNRNAYRCEIGSTNKTLGLQQFAIIDSLGIDVKYSEDTYTSLHNNKRLKVKTKLPKSFGTLLRCKKKYTVLQQEGYSDDIRDIKSKIKSIKYLGFIDEPSYDFETESDTFVVSGIQSHNCRTRIFEDITEGKNHIEGRGNLSFTSLNLPMLAQKSKMENYNKKDDIEFFKEILEKYVRLASEQLIHRYEYQKSINADNFKLLYGSTWLSKAQSKNVGDRLNVGSLAVGYIGLAECLVILTSKHHGESAKSQKLGLEIIKFINDIVSEYAKKYNLNISVIATPAEGLSGTSLRKFVKKYGEVENVTDYEFFTNSNHVPVYYDIPAKKKIEIEAPYHALTLGGHITYIEVDGDAQENLEALDDIVKCMARNDIGYGSINIPIDRCRNCGYSHIIVDNCPKCDSNDISRIRRITGYLVGDMEKWNTAKANEEKNRVKHQ